jgi:NADH:ubiquinone oxidoreductase subunit 3 (subunit A)
MFGRWLSVKSARDRKGESTYACGEKASFHKLRINVSLYRYLVYFVVVDSSILLVAFASLKLQSTNVLFLMLYLTIVLVSSLLLFEGGD